MQRLPGIENSTMTIFHHEHRDRLHRTVDELNVLIFGVDHRASDKVNTDLAEVYREALESIYTEAWNGELPYILRILQNVPGLIPEEEEQAVTDTIKSRLSAND